MSGCKYLMCRDDAEGTLRFPFGQRPLCERHFEHLATVWAGEIEVVSPLDPRPRGEAEAIAGRE